MKSPTFLITGAAGWLGVNLVKSLVHGLAGCEDVYDPACKPNLVCLIPDGVDTGEVEALGATVVRGDLRSVSDCRAFCVESEGGVLIHTAGVIHPDRVKTFYDINVNGTENVLEAAFVAGVRRAVVVSSNSVCGVNPHANHCFDESSPYRPYMNYGRSKMWMEEIVREYHEDACMETVIVRCPWFYGPNQPARQTLFFRMIQEGKVPLVGDGSNRRSMVYVDNLCQGLIRAALVERAVGQTYWIANEKPYTMNEIIETIEQVLEDDFGQKCAHKRLRLPSFVSEVAWLADWVIQTMGRYHQKIHVLSEMNKTIACSVEKACAELGYRPQIALREGMQRSLEFAYEHGQMERPANVRRVAIKMPVEQRKAA